MVDYPKCMFREGDICQISSALARIDVVVTLGACQVCVAEYAHRSVNRVTSSLAIGRMDKAGTLTDSTYKRLEKYLAKIDSHGPGAELHNIFAKMGVHYRDGCRCHEIEMMMNEKGPDGCIEILDTIVDMLRDEYNTRRKTSPLAFPLPFSSMIAKRLVKLAIHRARNHEPHPDISTGEATMEEGRQAGTTRSRGATHL